MNKSVEELLKNDSPTGWEIANSLRFSEGRRTLLLGYRILLGYENLPERELTDGERALRYYSEIAVGESPYSRGKVSRAARGVAHLAGVVAAQAVKEERERINQLAVEAMRPPQPRPAEVVELPVTEPEPQAA